MYVLKPDLLSSPSLMRSSPSLALLAHDLVDRGADACLERRLVDGLASPAVKHHLQQILRARQAARVGGQDALS